jgi:hypothetical protein
MSIRAYLAQRVGLYALKVSSALLGHSFTERVCCMNSGSESEDRSEERDPLIPTSIIPATSTEPTTHPVMHSAVQSKE